MGKRNISQGIIEGLFDSQNTSEDQVFILQKIHLKLFWGRNASENFWLHLCRKTRF
jgi:hypothetical protein